MSGILSLKPTALIVWPGRKMNDMLRPNVQPPLLDAVVDVDAAREETLVYVEAFMDQGIAVDLLGSPLASPGDAFAKRLNQLATPGSKGKLTIVADEVFSRWNMTYGSDSCFPEDWFRPRRCPNTGRTYFISAHMTADSRLSEHDMGEEALLRTRLITEDQIIRVLERDTNARCETGDILELWIDGRPITVFGISERSNSTAFDVWSAISAERGFGPAYSVEVFPNVGLHLTTGAGSLGGPTVLFDPKLINPAHLAAIPGIELLETHPANHGQQNAANCVVFPSGDVAMDDRFGNTIELVRQRGYNVIPLPNHWFAIGAGGLSCRSLRVGWFGARC